MHAYLKKRSNFVLHDGCSDKAKKLNAGRIITPDATLSKVFPKKLDMLQMAKVVVIFKIGIMLIGIGSVIRAVVS